ncbi:hypothetical protein D3C73_956590 [compost metagenome]
MPNERTAPMPGTNRLSGLKVAALMPSGATARLMTSYTMTTRNSRATRMPSTLADRSTLFTPSHPTIAMHTSTGIHQGTLTPSRADSSEETVKPNNP